MCPTQATLLTFGAVRRPILACVGPTRRRAFSSVPVLIAPPAPVVTLPAISPTPLSAASASWTAPAPPQRPVRAETGRGSAPSAASAQNPDQPPRRHRPGSATGRADADAGPVPALCRKRQRVEASA